MSTAPSRIRGWCPGALRPMRTGDGLIVRVRLTCGVLPTPAARAVATLAGEHGNGFIELSQRANVQLRGVRDDSLGAVLDGLAAIDALDPSVEAEAVRNVMVSPLAGIDPACADVREFGRQLEARLASDRNLQMLPGKFGFAIDGGGAMALGETAADVTLVVAKDGGARVVLQGAWDVAGQVGDGDGLKALVRVANLFLGERAAGGSLSPIRRMADVVRRIGAERILERAGLSVVPRAHGDERARPRWLGANSLDGAGVVVGVGLPFGELTARQLDGLAQAAQRARVSEMRLTPWRMVLLACSSQATGRGLVEEARTLGLIVSAADARAALDACPGHPACSSGETRSREDALRIAELLSANTAGPIHVSGCEKGCARSTRARLTLVGRKGKYDLVMDGRIGDKPILRGIAPELVAEAVVEILGVASVPETAEA